MIIFHVSTEKLSRLLFSIFICYVIVFGKRITHARMLPYLWTAPYKSEKQDDFIHGIGGSGSIKQFGYLQSIPNGTLILRSLQNSTNLQNLLLPKPVLDAIRLNLQQGTSNNKWDFKIFGEGTEHKFPPFLERILQRIQTYFSIYKYTDTSALESPIISVDSLVQDIVGAKANFTSLDTKLVGDGDSNLAQPLYMLEEESTVHENNSEFIEFIGIGECDDDYKVEADN